MMMALGLFVFDIGTASYQTLQRESSWRHASQSRFGERPAYQYVGPGEDTITLSGTLLPEFTGGRLTLDLLRVMAEQGKGWPLIEGSGRLYGTWAITKIGETSTQFFADGVPQRIEFTVSLERVDESRLDLLGSAINAGMGLVTGALSGLTNKIRIPRL